eukprot:TRINITY_DN19306_c0_g3_i1.p1 TRINITY_DN19306_c0_g3~~TRINITY_DN19306_c0_g3_i1.p1  ORF type:complete len:554 (+),score=110.49 TRINITY_DN19306_c0_g3_i1:191-1852(+)
MTAPLTVEQLRTELRSFSQTLCDEFLDNMRKEFSQTPSDGSPTNSQVRRSPGGEPVTQAATDTFVVAPALASSVKGGLLPRDDVVEAVFAPSPRYSALSPRGEVFEAVSAQPARELAVAAPEKPGESASPTEDEASKPLLPEEDEARHVPTNWFSRLAQDTVTQNYFEVGVGCAVVLNAASLGAATEYWAQHRELKTCESLVIIEQLFCLIFTSEWLLRIAAFGLSYFTGHEAWPFNYLDTFLVISQNLEQFLTIFQKNELFNVNTLRTLRALRLIRVTRLLRSFHLFDELRVIVSSVARSASSLGWSVAGLCCVIYIFTVILLQIILSAGETEHAEAFEYWFPGVFRTFLTLFECVVGGVSWDEVVQPLVTDIHPLVGVAFCIYVAIALFAMMNLLTGVFVDQAMRVVREDKDTVLAKRIADLFLDGDTPDELRWEDFEAKVDCKAMQEYFKQINVEASEARHLFDLLDADKSGSIDCKEIVDGCLRLRGPARALDLMTVHHQIRDFALDFSEFSEKLESKLGLLVVSRSDSRKTTASGFMKTAAVSLAKKR